MFRLSGTIRVRENLHIENRKFKWLPRIHEHISVYTERKIVFFL